MLHFKVITAPTKELLLTINQQKDFDQFYLAGGTALALQLGHRKSVDLDFFSQNEFSNNLIHKFPQQYQVLNVFNNSIEIISAETKIMFFYFAFALHFPVIIQEKITLADPRDIGMMKLLALQGRTTRKDIYDLYFIDQEIMPLENLLKIFETFYPKDKFNQYSSFKTLLNDQELATQPDPIMLKDVVWENALELVREKLHKHLSQQIMS
ncbi:MAG: nucleotidyl transferase AbiEii/AbiGii toxin family protein [bacterium]